MTKNIVTNLTSGVSLAAILSFIATGCSDEDVFSPNINDSPDKEPIEILASITPDNPSRADEAGWADGDRFGLFAVNHVEGEPATLAATGNHINNMAMTFDAAQMKWNAAADIYWFDDRTPTDFYGYYPYSNSVNDVSAYSFEVSADQDSHAAEGEISAYEASDFLWAKADAVIPGTKVSLTFGHIMAGVKVVLRPGNSFSSEEWAKLPRTVTVCGIKRQCTINLDNGAVAATGSYDRDIVMRNEGNDTYRAITVPQTVSAGHATIAITIDGVTRVFNHEGAMTYRPGKMHTFTLDVNKAETSGDFTLSLVGEDILDWEPDNISHDFDANTYIVINVDEAGTLEKCLEESGYDYAHIKSLKINGKLNPDDFTFIRQGMKSLTSINIKECRVVDVPYKKPVEGVPEWEWPTAFMDDKLPDDAFRGTDLHRIILPANLKRLGSYSMSGLRLSSELVMPNSVTHLESHAMDVITGGSIVMSDSLEYIGTGAFLGVSSDFELKLTNSITVIEAFAFENARGAYGTFSIPSGLKKIEREAFYCCGHDLVGDVVIPVGIEEIGHNAFRGLDFAHGTNLTLPEGLKRICSDAFKGMRFNSAVKIPESVLYIEDSAFAECDFAGNPVILPKNLVYLGDWAFRLSNLTGDFVFPETLEIVPEQAFIGNSFSSVTLGDNVLLIGASSFSKAGYLQKVTIGKNVTIIGEEAFADNPNLRTIICMAKEPPRISDNTFNGAYFDKLILEVPSESVELYRHSPGWNKIMNITAHHELACNISEIQCLDKGIERNGIVRAEGEWYVAECPSWVHVTPDHSEYNDEVTFTVDPLPTSASRQGNVVIRLRQNDYEITTTVIQHAYQYQQDTEITLQTATAVGNAIPVFIVGEGFGAGNIVNGEYMRHMNETMEQLFAIEPYKSYRNYFTVTTAVACSPDDGTGDIYTPKVNCFDSDGVVPNADLLRNYVQKVSPTTANNMRNALIIMISNHKGFGGWSEIASDGCSLSGISISDDTYPFDQRGLVQHYAGGMAFAGLGNEAVVHFEHIKGCSCPECADWGKFNSMKARGFYANLSASGKMNDAPWADFIFHPKYSAIVDMYEGGHNHLRGIWRSEVQSVMNNYVDHYNTISRYEIYRQIMKRAGHTPSLNDFIANDIID